MQGAVSLPAIPPATVGGHNITVKEMWNIAMRNNSVWGIDGYQVPKEYLDAKKMAEVSSGKMTRPAPRALKNLDYLHLTMRATKDVPAPNKYDIVKPWVDETKKGAAPKHVTKKNTYIDNIIQEAKLRPTPGPGAHNVLKDIDEKKNGKKEPKGSERTNFLCEMEYLSNVTPGPGNYNPRGIEPKLKENKMGPTEWRKKHTEQGKRSKSALPDGLTVDPFPVAYKTFAKVMDQEKKKEGSNKVKVWGTSSRFEFKKDTKKDPNNFPGPGTYGMTAEWNGKQAAGKSDKKDKNWMNKVTKGVEKSIYYS